MELVFALAFTSHIGFDGKYNEIHPHLRLDMGVPVAGAYLNSEENVSFYAGLQFEYNNFFIEGGGVTGYDYATVSPYIRAGYDFEHVTLFVAPGYEQGSNPKVGLVAGLEVKF